VCVTDVAWLKVAVALAALLLLVKPLGAYMARVYEGEPVFLDPVLRPLERLLYRLSGVRPEQEMDWQTYAIALVWFSAAGMLLLYGMQRLQAVLPLNPEHFAAVPPDLAFNTAASYVSATEWQNFGGESTMSYPMFVRSGLRGLDFPAFRVFLFHNGHRAA